MPFSDDELQSLYGDMSHVDYQSPASPSLPDETAQSQAVPWKLPKQIANIVPGAVNSLVSGAVGLGQMLQSNPTSDDDLSGIKSPVPTFNVGPTNSIPDLLLNRVAPEIAGLAIPYEGVLKGVTALGNVGKFAELPLLARIASEGLAQGVTNALGSPDTATSSGAMGLASGALQQGLPRWARALPLAAVSYAGTGGDTFGTALNTGLNLIPGFHGGGDFNVTQPKLSDTNSFDSLAQPQLPAPPTRLQLPYSSDPNFTTGNDILEGQANRVPFDPNAQQVNVQPTNPNAPQLPYAAEPNFMVGSIPDEQQPSGLRINPDTSLPIQPPALDVEQPSLSGLNLEGANLQQPTLHSPLTDLQSQGTDPNINFKLIENPELAGVPQTDETSLFNWRNEAVNRPQPLALPAPEVSEIPKVKTPITEVPVSSSSVEVPPAPKAKGLTEDKLQQAAAKITKRTGFPDVKVSDLAKELKLRNVDNLHQKLYELQNQGKIDRFGQGDWSLSTEEEKKWAIPHPSGSEPHPNVYVHFKSNAPEVEAPQVMNPAGELTTLPPRMEGPHIISTVLDEGDGQYLSGDKWNAPHQKGDDNIFQSQIEAASGNGKSAFLVQDENGVQRVTQDRLEAAKIAETAGQRKPETVGSGPLQSEDLQEPQPTYPAVPMDKPANKKYTVTINKQSPSYDEKNGISYDIEAKTKTDAIRYARRQATDDGHVGTGQGKYSISALEKVEETSTSPEPQQILQKEKATDAKTLASAKIIQDKIDDHLAAIQTAKEDMIESGDPSYAAEIRARSIEVAKLRKMQQGEAGGISTDAAVALAAGSIGGLIAYQQSKGDIGTTLAVGLIAAGLGAGGIKAIKALHEMVGPEVKAAKVKVPDATLKERLASFAKDTKETPGGAAVMGRGGIWANAVRQAEMMTGLNGSPFFRDKQLLANGFVAHEVEVLADSLERAKPFKPTPGFSEATGRFLRGQLANQSDVEALIKGGGGVDPATYASLSSVDRAAYPEKWISLDDPNSTNTKGDGVIVYHVTNSAKQKLNQMQVDALQRLATAPQDREFMQFPMQARQTMDNLMGVIHNALPPGEQLNRLMGTMGQYATRSHAIFTDPKYYPSEVEIQNAMNRLGALKDQRFIDKYGSDNSVAGSVPIQYNGKTSYIPQSMMDDWNNTHTPEALRSLVTQYIKEIKTTGANRANGLIDSGDEQLGSSLFSGRKELDEVTQALLGTHTTPQEIIANTINKLAPNAQSVHFMSQLMTLADERTGLPHGFSDELKYNKTVNQLKDQLKVTNDPRAQQNLNRQLQELSSYIPVSGSDSKMGIFQGSYVSRMAHDQLAGVSGGPFGILDNAIGNGLSRFNQLIKDTHLTLNPVTQVRNMIQIPMFLAMGNAAHDVGAWQTAIDAMKDPLSSVGRRAVLNGVYEGNPVVGEFHRSLTDLVSGKTDDDIFHKMVNGGWNLAQKLYAMPDNFVRGAVYFAAEKRAAAKFGVSVDDADPRVMDEARQFMSRRTLDYGGAPPIVKALRNIPFVSMYLTYTQQILKIAKNLAVDAFTKGDMQAGVTLGGFATLPFMLQNLAESKLSDSDRQAWIQTQRVVQDYSRQRFKMPLSRNSDGSFNYLDITPLSHFSDFQMMARAIKTGDWKAIMAVNPLISLDNTPILSLASDQIQGKDSHTGRTFRNIGDRTLAIAKEILPAHTPGIGYEWEKSLPEELGGKLGVTNFSNARTNTIEGALTRHLIGADYIQINPGIAMRNFVNDTKQHIADERQYLNDVLRSNISDDAKKRATQKFVEAVGVLTQNMQARLQTN